MDGMTCYTLKQMLTYTVIMVCTGSAISILAVSAFVSFVRNSFSTNSKEDK